MLAEFTGVFNSDRSNFSGKRVQVMYTMLLALIVIPRIWKINLGPASSVLII